MQSDHPRFPSRLRLRLHPSAYDHGGVFFVTICTENRSGVFGEIVDYAMRPNAAGEMIEDTWRGLPQFLPAVSLDAFQLMPNHLHGVVVIAAPYFGRPLSLPDVMQRFKSLTTRRYIDGVIKRGWPRFPGRLWQRGYHEHVVRNDRSLDRIREYVAANPAHWALDRENPGASSPIDE